MLAKAVKNKNLKPFILLVCLVIIIYASRGEQGVLIENLAIPIGVAYDIKSESPINYKVSVSTLAEDEKNSSYVTTTEAPNLGETRELRVTKLEKKVLYGLERIYLIGEKEAGYGIENIIDLWLVNTLINDRAYVVVCNGEAADILNSKFKSISNTPEYIEQLIKYSYEYNFFPKKFNVMDVMATVNSEGGNLPLPYIEIGHDGPEISGYAVFKNTKMELKTNLKEAKYINLMSFSKVKGMINLQGGPKSYANVYCQSKRKVKCYKENNKYRFVIDLKLTGDLISNELYKDLNTKPEAVKQLQEDMEKEVQKNCKTYIEKFKNQYKLDVLNLGSVGAATFGRDKGIDWNRVVSDSDIEVNVKVNITKQGRGDF